MGLVSDFLHLIYPNLCVGCHLEAVERDELFCVACEVQLPLTDFHQIEDNEAVHRMIGGFKFQLGCSMFRFYPGGVIQEIIHQIKYKGQTHLAFRLGKRYGYVLKGHPRLKNLDYIVPVPLHKNRQRFRGYNQSKYFADGLAEALATPVSTSLIKRIKDTSSQTTKSRRERLVTMQGAFAFNENYIKEGSHILLVDDVLTTGSTLEALAFTIAKHAEIDISFATIGLAQ